MEIKFKTREIVCSYFPYLISNVLPNEDTSFYSTSKHYLIRKVKVQKLEDVVVQEPITIKCLEFTYGRFCDFSFLSNYSVTLKVHISNITIISKLNISTLHIRFEQYEHSSHMNEFAEKQFEDCDLPELEIDGAKGNTEFIRLNETLLNKCKSLKLGVLKSYQIPILQKYNFSTLKCCHVEDACYDWPGTLDQITDLHVNKIHSKFLKVFPNLKKITLSIESSEYVIFFDDIVERLYGIGIRWIGITKVSKGYIKTMKKKISNIKYEDLCIKVGDVVLLGKQNASLFSILTKS